jgi:hypothetical protein
MYELMALVVILLVVIIILLCTPIHKRMAVIGWGSVWLGVAYILSKGAPLLLGLALLAVSNLKHNPHHILVAIWILGGVGWVGIIGTFFVLWLQDQIQNKAIRRGDPRAIESRRNFLRKTLTPEREIDAHISLIQGRTK